MEYKDYYKTLGVSKNATEKELKAAYRRLARKHHPDMNAGNSQAEARFKEINEAYEVLSDPEKRRRYDELGANWSAFESGAPRGGAPWGGGRVRVKVGGFDQDLGGFSDFFKTFFGGGGGAEGWSDESDGGGFREIFSRQRSRSADVEHEITITLEEALKGGTRTIRSAGGRTVEVKIPPALRDGSRIRIPGEGGGTSRHAGDLYLRVALAPHPQFSVEGDDLQTTVTVPISTAVLGGEVDVPTLDGRVGLKVPAGTPAGRVFRVKGQGLPRQGERSARGDLLVSLALAVPAEPSRRMREVFEELRRLGS